VDFYRLCAVNNFSRKTMKITNGFLTLIIITGVFLASCEGPAGPAGADGEDGADGKDANETCKLCHNSTVVEAKAIEYEHSLHFKGEAFEEGTRNSCAPCHSHQGFLDVIKNNTQATIVVNPTDPTKYINNYIASASALPLPGAISCFTCHSSLHKNYALTEFFPLATTAAVSMTMWGGAKTINFDQTSSNFCSKCHQPRPVTASSGALIDYSKLISEPATAYNLSAISYRTSVHYGAHSAMAAGVGGIEFGSGYENSEHKEEASCVMCHMATPSELAGGHSFNAAGNFTGCNTSGCHSGMSATSNLFVNSTTDIATKLAALGNELDQIVTPSILDRDESGGYTGYFNIYDPNSNPDGQYKSPSTTGWTDTQKAYNNTLPAMPAITNAQFGAVLNFQLVLRDASKGIHNYPYISKLLENTIAAI
jgi:nitrate/TMAO reductase-like tetraheme cytochrome c subunit